MGANITELKPGVGIYLTLQGVHTLRTLTINTPSSGWDASIYVTPDPPGSTLASWGQPVATRRDIQAGSTAVSLDKARGQAILVWITRLSPDGQVRISELGVSG